MLADYKYAYISLGRLKTLEMATSRFRDLYGEIAKSRVIEPALSDRMTMQVKQLLEPIAIDAVISAVVVYVAVRQWISISHWPANTR